MTPEQRQRLVELLQTEQELDPEWQRVLFPQAKREYELVYDGKEREEDILTDTMAVPLQRVRTFGQNGGSGWQNMLIFGDNLQVMKTLLEMKRAGELCNADGTPGVRLVYIDPPFATKQEFRGSQDQKAYQDKIAGAAFLEFLRKRLVFLLELLSKDGSIYVHLDWKKGHYVKILLDEIFGEQNFRNEIVWKRTRAQHSDAGRFGNVHDSLLVYSRGFPLFNARFVPHKAEYLARFSRVDEKNKKYMLIPAHAAGQGSPRKFGRKILLPPPGRHWAYSQKHIDAMIAARLIEYTSTGMPNVRQYLTEDSAAVVQDWWDDVTPLNPVADERMGYPTQKPEALLSRIVEASSNAGDLVLDSFAGSGTTLAVAEKLGRRWIGVDCGKLAIYTMQKRLMDIAESKDIENPKKKYERPYKPFILYNAGLYDFSRLRELPLNDWRRFALCLFQCKDDPHRVGGVDLDGYRKGGDVLVFNHLESRGAKVTYETIDDLHEALGSKVGRRFYIVAPALSFAFQEDYVNRGDTRYYALRIPYSIINELERRDFTAIRQPRDESEVNDTVEAVGFDFIHTPEAKVSYQPGKRNGAHFTDLKITVTTFKSQATARGAASLGNLESLSMVMVDTAYDGEVFDLDYIFYAEGIKGFRYTVRVPVDEIGGRLMLVLVDIYGNEFREVKTRQELGLEPKRKTRRGTLAHRKPIAVKELHASKF